MGAGEEAAPEGGFLSLFGRHLVNRAGRSSPHSSRGISFSRAVLLQGTSNYGRSDLRDIQHGRNDKTLVPTQPANKLTQMAQSKA